jgi:hypothetical protein
LAHEPHDVTLKAAGAAYRVCATGSVADLDLLLELAVELAHAGYRNALIEHALGSRFSRPIASQRHADSRPRPDSQAVPLSWASMLVHLL